MLGWWTAKGVVDFLCVVVMLGVPLGLLAYARYMRREFLGEGIIKFLAISEIVPAIVILGLEGVLDKASAGTLLAGVAGYVLGGIRDTPRPKTPPPESSARRGRRRSPDSGSSDHATPVPATAESDFTDMDDDGPEAVPAPSPYR